MNLLRLKISHYTSVISICRHDDQLHQILLSALKVLQATEAALASYEHVQEHIRMGEWSKSVQLQ